MSIRTSVASIMAAKTPFIEPHYGPDKYPRLRCEVSKIQVLSNGCWEWMPDKSCETGNVHVYLYELLYDPLDKGASLEPLCNTVGCVCPFHMKAVKSKSTFFSSWDDESIYGMPAPDDSKKLQAAAKPSKARIPIKVAAGQPHVVIPQMPVVISSSAPKVVKVAKAALIPVVDTNSAPVDVNVKCCQRAHPQTPENQYVYPNGIRKECKVCKRLRSMKKK